LTPEILPLLANQTPDHTGEVSLAQALNVMAEKDHILGKVIEGSWHDTGNKEKYLEAIVDVALEDPELSKSFREYLKNKL
jgi:UTP--glucose-1-phosphate uridylyltransferase